MAFKKRSSNHETFISIQNGLLNAISKNSKKPMTVRLAGWFQNAKTTFIDVWGWEEPKTSRYIAGYLPQVTTYFSSR
jgi:hypothetical protein